jgi:hypothetical protein
MIRYKDGKESLFINNKFCDQGTLVFMKHNCKLYKLIVPDTILADNITRETYENFRKISRLRREGVKTYDFTLCYDPSYVNTPESTEKLVNSNISSYVDTFRKIKVWNSYLCMLIMIFNWNEITNYDFSNQSIKEYILNVSKYISGNTSGVIRKLSNRIYEEIHFLSTYFSDIPFKLTFGMSLPISPENKTIKNTYLIVILFLIVIIIFLIFLYYYKLKDV